MAIFSPPRAAPDQILWNASNKSKTGTQSLPYYVECWSHDGLSAVEKGRNFREGWLGDPDHAEAETRDVELMKWLQHEGKYKPPPTDRKAGPLKGGIRLLMCDRPNMTCGMSISRKSFEAVSSAFQLPNSTLAAFCVASGVYAKYAACSPQSGALSRLSMVVKANQKVEVANYFLSISHDLATGWTTAFLCGDGVVRPRNIDAAYGQQRNQIVSAITTSLAMWTHPLLLPAVLLGNYCQRIDIRTRILERSLLDSEDELGVTIAGGAGKHVRSNESWPENVEVRETTIGLHSTASQIIFMLRTCDWALRYSGFVQDLAKVLKESPSLKLDEVVQDELLESILLVDSALLGMKGFFASLQERVQTQIGVLYNVISQQDSLVNRRDRKLNISIAASAKKDSIAMMTFTFITALFLPGTYVSSLFSMTFFNWQASAASSGNGSELSSYFWVYWAVTVPLTLITLVGWFVWYKYSDLEWHETMHERLGNEDDFGKMLAPRANGSRFRRLREALSLSRPSKSHGRAGRRPTRARQGSPSFGSTRGDDMATHSLSRY